MAKTQHDGDCTIYAVLLNGNPEDGICTCGYGHEQKWQLNFEEMYSEELEAKLLAESKEYWKTHKAPDLSKIFTLWKLKRS